MKVISNAYGFPYYVTPGMLEYWNDGILGFGLRLVEPTARRGNWNVGRLEKSMVDMGEKVSNNKKIPLKTTFHYSTIPLFHVRGKKQVAPKNLLDFL